MSGPERDGPRPDGAPDEPLGIAYRLILHIARQGRFGPDEIAPRALCQAGMVEALGVTQGALVGFLQEFVAAGVLTVGREHVHGVDRRVKVYRLTELGEGLVREIRRRQSPAPAPFAPSGERPRFPPPE